MSYRPKPFGGKRRHRRRARDSRPRRDVRAGTVPARCWPARLPPGCSSLPHAIPLPIEPAARGELELRFGRQPLARPLRVGQRVLPGDVHDRMILAALRCAARPLGMPPVRARRVAPPLQRIVERHRPSRRREHRRAGDQLVARHAGKVLRVGRPLGDGDVAGGLHEPLRTAALVTGVASIQKPSTRDQVHRQRVGHPAVLASHPERAARESRPCRPAPGRGVERVDVRGEGGSRSRCDTVVVSRRRCRRRFGCTPSGGGADGDQDCAQGDRDVAPAMRPQDSVTCFSAYAIASVGAGYEPMRRVAAIVDVLDADLARVERVDGHAAAQVKNSMPGVELGRLVAAIGDQIEQRGLLRGRRARRSRRRRASSSRASSQAKPLV